MAATMKLVMVWRRVLDLRRAGELAAQVLRLPKIGEDPYTQMYDAGGAILAYWSQEALLETEELAVSLPLRRDVATVAREAPAGAGAAAGRVSAAGAALAGEALRDLRLEAPVFTPGRLPLGPEQAPQIPNQCSIVNLARYPLGVNPASQLAFIAPRIEPELEVLTAALGSDVRMLRSAAGATAPFLDESGNAYAFHTPTLQPSMPRALRGAVNAFMDRREDSGAAGGDAFQVQLQVADPKRSQAFYSGILGMSRLGSMDDVDSYDAGTLIVSLRREDTPGLLRALRRTERILGDLFVFHVDDLDEAVRRLAEQGIQFPTGIELSVTGRMANFRDPDGYLLTLWEPAGPDAPDQPINFYPVLERILAAGQARPA